MKRSELVRRGLFPLIALALVCSLSIPSSAFFWSRKADAPAVADFAKNGLVGESIAFTDEDFAVQGEGELVSITLEALPDPGAGTLTVGEQPLSAGSEVEATALSGLRFQILNEPSVDASRFTFTPAFSDGTQGKEVTVTLHLLSAANEPPIARNMELSTYKNVAITGYFDAVDGEGDTLTFQLVTTPARGGVELAEDGSAQFVYTPYENKTGKDSFLYVAIDSAGNTSEEAKVSIQIKKPDTKVTYADLDGNPAHKAAIRLAEEGVYVGACVNGQYFFEPDRSVSRAEFLALSMAAAGLDPLEGVTMTGFSDDDAIPTWAKGTVSAALKAGVIQGTKDEAGAPVFRAEAEISRGEAAVMLNRLLALADVPQEVFASSGTEGHWAAQAAANLTASGVTEAGNAALSDSLTLGDAAELLDGALDVLDARNDKGWFPW